MNPIWIVRDYESCTGCRRCELACSLHHEGWFWPEASRVRVFMPFPGVEVPHLCAQCDDYLCVEAFDRLLWIMAKREGIGDILAEGTYRAAKKIGERKRLTYFETLGWDERGIPKTETLNRLGLKDLEPSMKGLRE